MSDKPTRTRPDIESVDSAYPYDTYPAIPPRDRRDFEIAIICALPLEASVKSDLRMAVAWQPQS
jgi:hypothetical protein